MTEAGNAQGFLVPPWYEATPVPDLDMNIVSIFWGFALALAVFTAKKAIRQSIRSWKHRRRVTAYIAMVWGHWIANVIPSFIVWLHIWGIIPQSLWLSLFIAVMWAIQINLVFQIIINRISLLMIDRFQSRRLKWGAFGIVLIFGLTVIIVWVPANLQISPQWIKANAIWDRFKQVSLLIMDLCLNAYFLYIVRYNLISNGLTKYNNLFKYNILMVVTVVALDIALIGLISLPVKTAYLQFQTIVYLTRLNIEMENAELIRKILKVANQGNLSKFSNTVNSATLTSGDPPANDQRRFWSDITRGANHRNSIEGNVVHVELGPMITGANNDGHASDGIQKTVVTEVLSEDMSGYRRRRGSATSSTTPLQPAGNA